MTLAECKAHTANDASMWLESRFAICESQWFSSEWFRNRTVVGFSQMTVTAIATVPDAKSRQIQFDYYYSDFFSSGVNGFDETLVGPVPNYETVPSGVTLSQGGSLPGPESIAQIRTRPHFMVTASVAPGHGLAPDDGVWGDWNMRFAPEWPTGWTDVVPGQKWSFASFGVRWDNSSYLPNYNPADPLHTGGAAFSYDITPLRYSTATTAAERAVTLHIQKAFTQPKNTMPANPSKKVAGQSASNPLHRLQPGLNVTNQNRYNKNRSEAVKVCKSVDPDYASKGLECDEYPFASTYEGAAQSIYDPTKPAKNFSALALNATQNGKAGSQLGAYYNNNRILDGANDEYYVVIIT